MKRMHVSPDNACHLYCWVTWPAMSQKHTHKLWQDMAAVFAWHAKTHFGPLANNSLSCSWNNSYCAPWAYVSCHVYLCAKTQKGSQKLQAQQRSLFDSGEMALISLSHSRASSPVKGFGEVSYHSATRLTRSTFPTGQLWPLRHFQYLWQLPLTVHQLGYFDLEPSQSMLAGQTRLLFQRWYSEVCHCLCWPTNFWERLRELLHCQWKGQSCGTWPTLANIWRHTRPPTFPALVWLCVVLWTQQLRSSPLQLLHWRMTSSSLACRWWGLQFHWSLHHWRRHLHIYAECQTVMQRPF